MPSAGSYMPGGSVSGQSASTQLPSGLMPPWPGMLLQPHLQVIWIRV